jgi:hypothetical protein
LKLGDLQNHNSKKKTANLSEREYFIKAKVHFKETYTYMRRMGPRSVAYDKTKPIATTIRARTYKEAVEKFKDHAKEDVEQFLSGKTTPDYLVISLDDIDIEDVVSDANFKPSHESITYMQAAKPIIYNFIPADDKFDTNQNFCVPDTFLGIYSQYIKSLNLNRFIDLCYQVRGEKRHEERKINLLDEGIKEVDEDKETKQWTIQDGVTPKMLNDICQILDISHYAFDITKKCFLKSISNNRNAPALVYYCVNNHMYWISDKNESIKLINRSKDITTKIKSIVIEEEDKKTNFYKDRTIYENIKISELENYNECTIIYTKTNLNEELDEIIGLYGYVPEVKNNKYLTTQINFNKDNRDVILVVDPNDQEIINYKRIQELCKKHDIEFKNQSFGKLIAEVKDKFFNAKSIRHNFTTDERLKIFNDNEGVCSLCDKELTLKNFHIDHILPLACGGTNDIYNLQVLCKPCHFEKSKNEKEEGYIKLSDTESSFNSTTKEIFNSSLNGHYAFIETITQHIPKKLANNKIFYFDINRCRKTNYIIVITSIHYLRLWTSPLNIQERKKQVFITSKLMHIYRFGVMVGILYQ